MDTLQYKIVKYRNKIKISKLSIKRERERERERFIGWDYLHISSKLLLKLILCPFQTQAASKFYVSEFIDDMYKL